MESESKIVLPLEGTTEPAPHISIEVITEASKQVDAQLTKNAGFKSQLQKTLTDVQTNLNQVIISETILNGQKAILEEIKKKITELLTSG